MSLHRRDLLRTIAALTGAAMVGLDSPFATAAITQHQLTRRSRITFSATNTRSFSRFFSRRYSPASRKYAGTLHR